jgi:hypothetical protein
MPSRVSGRILIDELCRKYLNALHQKWRARSDPELNNVSGGGQAALKYRGLPVPCMAETTADNTRNGDYNQNRVGIQYLRCERRLVRS